MDAIVLAAGVGARMNLDYPKQFYKINGKPFFIYSLEVINSCQEIDQIIMTCAESHIDLYRKYLLDYDLENVICIPGGNTRQMSVFNGLEKVKSEKVLIHEAARPLISKDFVDYLILESDCDAVIPTIPVKFTVVIGSNNYMSGELDRSTLHNVQLPQIFNRNLLLDVHRKAIVEGYKATEDGMLFYHYGGKVKLVEGRESNIKVTTPIDIEIVEKLLNLSY